MDDDLDKTIQDSSTGPWRAKGDSGQGEQLERDQTPYSPWDRGLQAKFPPPAANSRLERVTTLWQAIRSNLRGGRSGEGA